VRRLGLFYHVARFDRDVPESTILARLSVALSEMDVLPILPGGAQEDCLDHISSNTGMSLTDTISFNFSGTKSFAVEGSRYRPNSI